MKLAALLCVALFSVGCATDEVQGGGQLAGLRPAKPSLDNIDSPAGAVPQVPTDFQKAGMIHIDPLLYGSDVRAETIKDGHAPLPNEVCGGCEVTLITVNSTGADNGSVGKIDVVNDGGDRICVILVNTDGTQDASDCLR